MANVTTYLNKILSAVYGKDVRQSIYDSINAINTQVEGYVSAEKSRVTAEANRNNRGEVDAWYIEDDHEAIVSPELWQKAQDALAAKRDYLAKGSVIEEFTEENYPYMNKIYCAKCGYPLYKRVYSKGNRLNWGCSGTKRYGSSIVLDMVLDHEGMVNLRLASSASGSMTGICLMPASALSLSRLRLRESGFPVGSRCHRSSCRNCE